MDLMASRREKRSYIKAPAVDDRGAWKAACASAEVNDFQDRDLLAAWDTHRNLDVDLARQLEKLLVKRVQIHIHKWLGNKIYGKEHEFWKTVENDVTFALSCEQSENGSGLRESLGNFIKYRVLDLIRREKRLTERQATLDDEQATLGDPTDHIISQIDLKRAIHRFCDGDERKMSVISMELKGFTQAEIHDTIQISHVTQKRWFKELKDYLDNQGID